MAKKKELIETVATQGNVAKALLDEMNTRRNNASLIQEMGQSVSGIVDIDKIAKTVLKIVEKHLKYDCGIILLKNEKKTHLELAANFSHHVFNLGSFCYTMPVTTMSADNIIILPQSCTRAHSNSLFAEIRM